MTEIDGNKVLLRMMKKGSPTLIFSVDLDDDYFIHILKVRKTGKTVSESMIIRPDIKQWIEVLKRKGYVEKED